MEGEWQFRVCAAPSYAGAYWIGGIGIGIGMKLKNRPNWLHRFTMRVWFGWEWRDAGPALSQSIAPTWTGRDA